MSTEAKVTMSAEAQQLIQTLASVQKGFDKLSDTLTKQEEQSKKTNKEAVDGLQSQESTLTKTVAAAGRLAAGYISVGAAIKLASAEYEAWTRKLDASANLATKFSADMTAAAKNTAIPQGDLEKVVMSASGKTGIRPTFYSNGLDGILAAGGGSLNKERLESILTASAPIAGGNAADYAGNASALALYRANAGAAGDNLTDRQILGYFSSAAEGGLVDSQSQYNNLAARIMAAASANGIDEGESLALFNSIQKASSDKTGDTSVTATIKAISGMAAVRESMGMQGERSVAKLAALTRGNGGAFSKFMDTATFMTENKAAVGSLFAPGGNGGLLDQALANTPTLATGEAAYNELLGSLRSSSINRSVAEGESLAAAGERIKQPSATTFTEAQINAVVAKLAHLGETFRKAPPAALQKLLRDLIARIEIGFTVSQAGKYQKSEFKTGTIYFRPDKNRPESIGILPGVPSQHGRGAQSAEIGQSGDVGHLQTPERLDSPRRHGEHREQMTNDQAPNPKQHPKSEIPMAGEACLHH